MKHVFSLRDIDLAVHATEPHRSHPKSLHPRDRVTIGKRDYVIKYDAPASQKNQLEEVQEEDVLSMSLLERAGLAKPSRYDDDD